MKKKILSGILVLLIVVSLIPSVGAQGSFVWDEAGILTDDQMMGLEKTAQELCDRYKVGVYLVTVPEYRSKADSLRDFAKDFYRSHDLGYGPDKDGIMLMLSMNERKFWLLGYGDSANTAMTDYGREVMTKKFVDDFKDDDWYSGFEDYLEQAEYYLDTASEGKPFDKDTRTAGTAVKAYGIGFGAAVVIALITCLVFLSQMKTAKQKVSASAYVPTGGVEIRKRVDRYTHTTTQRTKIESSSGSSGSSGGGTSRDSDGFSGSGGSF